MQHGTLLRTATYTRTGAYSFVIVMKGMLIYQEAAIWKRQNATSETQILTLSL